MGCCKYSVVSWILSTFVPTYWLSHSGFHLLFGFEAGVDQLELRHQRQRDILSHQERTSSQDSNAGPSNRVTRSSMPLSWDTCYLAVSCKLTWLGRTSLSVVYFHAKNNPEKIRSLHWNDDSVHGFRGWPIKARKYQCLVIKMTARSSLERREIGCDLEFPQVENGRRRALGTAYWKCSRSRFKGRFCHRSVLST